MSKSNSIAFIDQIKGDALEVQAKIGIPAAVIIAQACLETGFGQKLCIDVKSGRNSKNLFNIKGVGPAGTVECWTTEYYDGVKHRVSAKFRAYRSYEESFADHSQLMLKKRYAPCMAVKNNPREFARKLQQCGYATDPKYAEKLIKIMEMFGLLNLKEEDTVTPEVKELIRTMAVIIERLAQGQDIKDQAEYVVPLLKKHI